MARLVQPDLQQRLGATIIVENKPGASGSVGTSLVAKSPPDGNNWLLVFDNHAANPFVLPSLPYNTEKDFDPVLFIGTAPYVVSTLRRSRSSRSPTCSPPPEPSPRASTTPRSAAAASATSPWCCCPSRRAYVSSTCPIGAAAPR